MSNDKPARIVSKKPRYKTVPLDWPVEFNGKTYSAVNISRLTVLDIVEFSKSLESASEDETTMLPMYFDDEMNPIPREVFEAMDVDDKDALDIEALSFLPKRFRGLTEPSTTSNIGDITEPMSEKN